MWETLDPDGRRVALSPERWLHILERHAELELEPHTVLEVVGQPDFRLPGPRAGEERFYRSGLGPSRWLRVVVHYEGDRGVVVREPALVPRERGKDRAHAAGA